LSTDDGAGGPVGMIGVRLVRELPVNGGPKLTPWRRDRRRDGTPPSPGHRRRGSPADVSPGGHDEPELTAAIDAVLQRGKQVTWAIDLADGPAALALTLLLERGQRLLYLPGVAVNRISAPARQGARARLLDVEPGRCPPAAGASP
jgi:hypothetical protein